MGYIYKITNSVNGKIYVGQTCRSVEMRWGEHLRHINGDYPINKAMKKYGVDSFAFEVIEKCDDEILNDREIYWISFYRSNKKQYGYNCTAGGLGSKSVDYDIVYSLWDDGLSTGEIAKIMGIEQGTVVYILSEYDQYSVEEGKKRGYELTKKSKGRPVCQYDLDGNYIATFLSSKDAARNVAGSTRQNIYKSCMTKKGQSGGSQWRFADDYPPGAFKGATNLQKPVMQYDMSGKYIQTFKTIKDACKETGCDSSSILHCCRGRYKSSRGYKWAYES